MNSITREGEENRSLTHNNDKCVGCGICTSICPTESIKNGPILPIARGLVDMDYININKDSCCFVDFVHVHVQLMPLNSR